ncbi:MAG TPA: hypothetical protein VKG45_10825 [Actinomycetes bacterium]|nr:hypothetical protein [Actinomycetes bacterium]
MARRVGLAGLPAVLLLTLALAVPAQAAPTGPTTVVPAGCNFEAVTGDAAVAGDGVTRGFVSFHGGGCGSLGTIRYFEGSGTVWTSSGTSLRGRVLGVADDGATTFLLFQATSGIWITRKAHGGPVSAGRRLSSFSAGAVFSQGDVVAFTDQWWAVWTEQVGVGEFAPSQLFQGKTIGAGDCIDPINRQRITQRLTNDESPSLVLKPASAGASGADLVWSRNDGAQGLSGHIWLASAGCSARWTSRQLSFAGRLDLAPDLARTGGVDHAAWSRDDARVVHADDAGGTWSTHTFNTRGLAPRVTASGPNAFVAFTNLTGHPFVAVRRGPTTWTGSDLTPTAGSFQEVVAITATGGVGTLLAASDGSDRLYAVAHL